VCRTSSAYAQAKPAAAALSREDYERLLPHLCWCILSSLDRLPANEMTITQERISDMLGVRRESVTEAVGTLQTAGLIHCRRGHITVLDRRQLEARVCECYMVVKREYDRLLHEYGKMAAPASVVSGVN
jgi:DNA-binding transcriptional MocR family regulator